MPNEGFTMIKKAIVFFLVCASGILFLGSPALALAPTDSPDDGIKNISQTIRSKLQHHATSEVQIRRIQKLLVDERIHNDLLFKDLQKLKSQYRSQNRK